MTPDVRIGRVETEIVVAESVGPLSPEEVGRIVALAAEEVLMRLESKAAHDADVAINDRVFPREG